MHSPSISSYGSLNPKLTDLLHTVSSNFNSYTILKEDTLPSTQVIVHTMLVEQLSVYYNTDALSILSCINLK